MSVNTTPATWAAGEIPTAAKMNTEIRDLATGLQAAWTAYTPSWTGTSNPVIGNGTLDGAYMRVGKTIHFRVKVTMGSTTTYGSGGWLLTLPVAPKSGIPVRFTLGLLDATGSHYLGTTAFNSGSSLYLLVHNGGAGGALGQVAPTVPFTWAVNDTIELTGTYEGA